MVTLVVTRGNSSVDLYSLRLSQYLKVPIFTSDVYHKSAYNVSWISLPSFQALYHDFSFLASLWKIKGIVHIPNHHMGRFAHFLRRPFIITVHDLIRYFDLIGRFPTPLIHLPNGRDRFLLSLDYRGINKAIRIIVPSFHTKEDLIQYLGISSEKIAVIPHGVDPIFCPRDGDRPLQEPYLLYVGSEHPRKNLPFLFRVFKEVKRSFPALKLIKIGRAGGVESDFRAQTIRAIRELKLEDEVIIHDFMPQDQLARFFAHAEAFVFPSLYEGFGWPPLEAMACGTPVIASRATSIPEVVGDDGLLCSPGDLEEWVSAIERLLTEKELREELRNRGLERARRFSWEEAARRTLEVYREVEAELA